MLFFELLISLFLLLFLNLEKVMNLLVKIGSFLLNGFIVIIAMFSPLALCLKSQQVELSSKSGQINYIIV